jgi:hypothetical protein
MTNQGDLTAIQKIENQENLGNSGKSRAKVESMKFLPEGNRLSEGARKL